MEVHFYIYRQKVRNPIERKPKDGTKIDISYSNFAPSRFISLMCNFNLRVAKKYKCVLIILFSPWHYHLFYLVLGFCT